MSSDQVSAQSDHRERGKCCFSCCFSFCVIFGGPEDGLGGPGCGFDGPGDGYGRPGPPGPHLGTPPGPYDDLVRSQSYKARIKILRTLFKILLSPPPNTTLLKRFGEFTAHIRTL